MLLKLLIPSTGCTPTAPGTKATTAIISVVNCSGQASINAQNTMSKLNQITARQSYVASNDNNSGVLSPGSSPVSSLPSYAKNLGYEVGYTAEKGSTREDIYMSNQMTQYNPIGVVMDTDGATIASLHTHPKGDPSAPNLTGPSSADFLFTVDLVDKTKNNQGDDGNGIGYTDSYIYSHDGSVYSLHVEDKQKAIDFKNNNPQLFTPEGRANNAREWEKGSTLDDTFKNAKNAVQTATKDINEVHDYAMAAVMKQAGITLLKKGPTDTSFRQMSATKSGSIYFLQKCR